MRSPYCLITSSKLATGNGESVPGGEVGQALWIGGGYHRPFRLVWPIGPSHDLYGPPLLSLPDTLFSKRVMEEKRPSLGQGGEEENTRSSH